MSTLIIAVGYDRAGAAATPTLVYLGRSSEGLRQALSKTDAVRVDIIRNPPSIRKSNPQAYAARLAGYANQVVAASVSEPITPRLLTKRQQAVADKKAAAEKKAKAKADPAQPASTPPPAAPNSPKNGESSPTPPTSPDSTPAQPPSGAGAEPPTAAGESDDDGAGHFDQ